MKKVALILSSLALLFGLTQCKKNLDTVNPAATGKVDITYSTGGSKTNITGAGVVTWTAGDVCHVYASTTGYLGALTLSAGAGTNTATFSGSLSAWTDDETLRFYYLGTNTKNTDNTFVIDYSAQDGTLATIASKYHVSCYTDENVPASKTSFSGQMLNQMALAVFDVNGFGSGNVKIYAESGFRNMIKISSTGELSYGVAGINPDVDNLSGHIVIGAAGAKKYVALLPSDGEITMQFTSQSKTGSDEARTIAANDFIGSSAAVAITAADVVSDYVDLAVASDHVFTVASGTTVKFAKGNLVYDQGRFKMHSTQYGRCFTSYGDASSQTKVSGTFDLFGWGTAGWNNGNLLYMPYTHSKATDGVYSDEYGYGYGPTDGSNYKIDLTGTYANSDWGVYQFGMDAESGWRTLTKGEWVYLFNTRSTPSGIRYAKAQVNNVNGVILLPDNWSASYYALASTNTYNANFTTNTITVDDWTNSLEANGAVFLPAAGARAGTDVYVVGSDGRYWSSSASEVNEHYAYGVDFYYLNVYPDYNSNFRNNGQCVRLVTEGGVTPPTPEPPTPEPPTPVDPVFTVNDGGTTVHFSPGNLQYKSSEGWRFAEHQYDVIRSWNTGDWVDFFGWGTWGSGKNPLNESTNAGDYQWSTDFQVTLDGHDDWRTPTKDEWVYVFNTRSTTSGVRYAKATVNGVSGVILLPDNWSTSYYTLTSTNTSNAAYTSNVITLSDWNTMLEANGAVFLPVAGCFRYGTGVYYGDFGNYWSSSAYDDDYAWDVDFSGLGVYMNSIDRYHGYSVRLVR